MQVGPVNRNLPIIQTNQIDFQKDNSPQKQREEIQQKILNKDLREIEKDATIPIAEKVVIEAIERANKAIEGAKKEFRFSIHEQTREIMVKVIDKEKGEVIREIPPEKILDMVAWLWEMAGIIVDERR